MTESDLPHGVYYVTRDASTVYRLDAAATTALRLLASDEAEAAVALALIDVGQRRINNARHEHHTGAAAIETTT